MIEGVDLVAPTTNITNDKLNDDNVKILDDILPTLLKDADKNIKHVVVLSQEKFNTTEPSSDTLYFINDITEDVMNITNILDIAVSHTSYTNDQPEYLWVLSCNTENNEVDLWRTELIDGNLSAFKLMKVFLGYVDGRLTFDGTYEYLSDYTKSTLITKDEPFIVLINSVGEMYAFPSLKYKTDRILVKDNEMLHIDGDENERVIICSVDKGYGSNLFKEEDQGVVIAYVTSSNGFYYLKYIQYGYAQYDSTVKTWGAKVIVTTKTEPIFSVNIRRLNDYRLGLTYNYFETVDDERIARTEFRYSTRTYSGVAFHPEILELDEIPNVTPLLYGVVRNDNIHEVVKPYLEELEVETGKKETQLTLGLFTGDKTTNRKEVTIELLNPKDPSNLIILDDEASSSEIENNVLNLLDLTVKNSYPYGQHYTENDPIFGDQACSIAVVKNVQVDKNKVIITLDSHGLPMTPFEIIPNVGWNEKINVRFVADDFNDEQLDTNMSGWFALDDFKGGTIGSIHTVSGITEDSVFTSLSVSGVKVPAFKITTQRIEMISTTFTINSWNYSGSWSATQLTPTIDEQNLNFIIRIDSLICNKNFESYGGTNVNV